MSRRKVPSAGRLAVALAFLASCNGGAREAADDGNRVAKFADHIRTEGQIRAMGPDGWHRVALFGNWDFIEPEDWRWIVTQPSCDRATALAIFWKAEPEYYLDAAAASGAPAAESEGYALIALIRDRWAAGAYTRSELAFDPDVDAWPIDMAALKRRHGDRVEQLMPASMRVRLAGRRITDEGPPLPGVFRS